jgi:hypothetical protein
MPDFIEPSPFGEPEEPMFGPLASDEPDPDPDDDEDDEDQASPVDDRELTKLEQSYMAYPDRGALRPRWLVEAKSLEELTEEDLTPPCYRIEDLAVCDGSTNIFALYKTGKSVLLGNVARSLADNIPFLNRFEIEPVQGNIGILNFEMIAAQFNYWLDQQDIRNRKRIIPLHLRGEGAYVEDDEMLGYLVEYLNRFEIEILLIDTLTSALKPESNPNLATTAAMFTSRLDSLRLKTGLRDVFLASHTGHPTSGQRSGVPLDRHTAGSQKFMAWAEANWDYSMDATNLRYLSTSGRIEDWLPRTEVLFDLATKQLTLGRVTELGAGSSTRPQRDPEQARHDVSKVLRKAWKKGDGWLSKNAVEDAVKGARGVVRQSLEELVDEGLVEVMDGPRGSKLHRWIR